MGRYTRRSFLKTSSTTLGTLALTKRFGFSKTPATEPSSDLTLWYDKPAVQWVDALPIGNGRLGAMVFGGGEDGARLPKKSGHDSQLAARLEVFPIA